MPDTQTQDQPPSKPPGTVIAASAADDDIRALAERIVELDESQTKQLKQYLKGKI